MGSPESGRLERGCQWECTDRRPSAGRYLLRCQTRIFHCIVTCVRCPVGPDRIATEAGRLATPVARLASLRLWPPGHGGWGRQRRQPTRLPDHRVQCRSWHSVDVDSLQSFRFRLNDSMGTTPTPRLRWSARLISRREQPVGSRVRPTAGPPRHRLMCYRAEWVPGSRRVNRCGRCWRPRGTSRMKAVFPAALDAALNSQVRN
jgi:hypothetical protein